MGHSVLFGGKPRSCERTIPKMGDGYRFWNLHPKLSIFSYLLMSSLQTISDGQVFQLYFYQRD
jgi:hypothetical protein